MEEALCVDVENGIASYGARPLPLTRQEVAVLGTLADAGGRVVSRTELARGAGLRHASPRRAESLLVTVRRVIGDDAVRTVRGRGWALQPQHIRVEE
jgi:DNA-binding response OmpR family regulator